MLKKMLASTMAFAAICAAAVLVQLPTVEKQPLPDAVPDAVSEATEDDFATVETVSDSSFQTPWYRSQLTDPEKGVYDALLLGIRNVDDDIPVPDTDAATLEKCFLFALFDNPDVFWMGGGYQYTSRNGKIKSVQPEYETADRQFIEERAKAMEQMAEEGRLYADQGANTYEKLALLFSWIADRCEYDVDAPDSQDIESFFVNGVSACAGYSKAFQYICSKMGIPCIYVTGDAYANGDVEHHAWNGVDIDGTVVYLDVTWGDRDGAAPTDYSWLGLSLQDMSVSHVPDYPDLIPHATSDAYEYWTLHSGDFAYFDERATIDFLKGCIEAGQESTSIRFASADDMDACHAFFTQGAEAATEISRAFPGRFPDPEGRGVYSIYKQDGLRAVVFTWQY